MQAGLLKLAFNLCFAVGLSAHAADTAADNIIRISRTPMIADCRIGLDGRYKIGHWTPIRVVLNPGVEARPCDVEIEVVDNDGVPTTVSTQVTVTAKTTVPMVVKIGRLGSSVHVRIRSDGNVVEERTIRPGVDASTGRNNLEIPATGELIVAYGVSSIGLTEAFGDRNASAGIPARHAAQLVEINELPNDWLGYDGVDVLVLSLGNDELSGKLADDRARLGAISQWVTKGGRLVVLCGGRSAGTLLSKEHPFTSWAPGQFVDAVPLPDTSALEHYAQTEAPLVPRGSPNGLFVTQLAKVNGQVELYGSGGSRLPLVIRSPKGLGEITFVGVNLTESPVLGWSGQVPFLRALLRPYTVHIEGQEVARNLVTSGFDDLSGALRQQLGSSFAGVRPFSFSNVVGLAILYIFCLGPAHYLLVYKWRARPWLAWLSLPLVMLLFGTGALLVAKTRSPAGAASVNQLELVDVDTETGRARGTYWATLYSPQARRFDLRFAPSMFGQPVTNAEVRLSWHGLAGTGIGGMSASGNEFGFDSFGYRYAAADTLSGTPVLTAATKSLLAGWNAPVERLAASKLTGDGGMITGTFTNETGVPLRHARLLYGTWAYRLKDIEPGATVTVDEKVTPISIPTLISGAALGSGTSGAERPALQIETASTAELLGVMMFYEAAGGERFARLPLRYQADCDLSRLLALGRAVLVAEVPPPGSRLIDAETEQTLGAGDSSIGLTVVRFVLPVEIKVSK
jgi:hypothetical protein